MRDGYRGVFQDDEGRRMRTEPRERVRAGCARGTGHGAWGGGTGASGAWGRKR